MRGFPEDPNDPINKVKELIVSTEEASSTVRGCLQVRRKRNDRETYFEDPCWIDVAIPFGDPYATGVISTHPSVPFIIRAELTRPLLDVKLPKRVQRVNRLGGHDCTDLKLSNAFI
jgi:hypothetical protein